MYLPIRVVPVRSKLMAATTVGLLGMKNYQLTAVNMAISI